MMHKNIYTKWEYFVKKEVGDEMKLVKDVLKDDFISEDASENEVKNMNVTFLKLYMNMYF